jgi:hypothetical protein
LSQPIQTLHDFVLNLITDDSFGTSFLSDPTGVLSDAGLGDVTGLDVQEVTSLVADHLPAPVADAVESGFAALPADVTGVNDLHCALAHLETVAAVAQGLPATVTGLSTSSAFSGDADGFAGAAALASDTVQASGTLAGGTGGIAGGVLADTPAGAVTSAVAATTDSAAAGLQSPLGTYAVSADSLPLPAPSFGSIGDLGSTLDSDALTEGTPVTAVAANYVASGGEFAAAGIGDNSATLAGHLSAVGGMAAQAVATGGDQLAAHVASGSSMIGDAVSHVPSVGAPAQLPTDLPVHPVADLPHTLPAPDAALPHVTHMVESTVSHASVTDAVSHSSLVDTVHSALPQVEDLHTDLFSGDLPLGH